MNDHELLRLAAIQVAAARHALDQAYVGNLPAEEAVRTAIYHLSMNQLAAKLDAVTYPTKERG